MKVKLYVNNTTLDATKDMIKAIDNSDFFVEHIVVVPDKFSLQMEKLLLHILPSKSLFNVKVVGLTSLATEIFKKLGMNVEVLSSGESLLLTEQAIENVKDEFLTFRKKSISFCYEINKIIAQLKSSNVSEDELNEEAVGITGAKYHDLSLIYKEYQKLLNGKLDANERLGLLCDVIKKDESLKDTKVYFAQFDSFTAEGYKLIKTLIQCAKEVNISVSQSINIGNEYIYEKDIYQKLNSLAKELGCSISVENKENNYEKTKEAIVKGLYSYDKVSCENKGFYNSYVSNNLTEEVEAVAKTIYYFITKGYQFKDIVVMTSDLNKYENYIVNAFSKFNFPYYIDLSTTADKTLLGNLINLFFETVVMGYPNDKIISLLSSSLLGKDDELIKKSQLYSVDGKNKYKKFISKDFKEDCFLQRIEETNKAEEFGKIIIDICEYIQDNFDNVMEELEEKNFIKEKNINLQVFDIIKETVDLITKYQNEEINAKEYLKKFNLLMSFKEVSTVPSFVDGILVGDASTSSCLNSKILFILGCQNLPISNNDNGLLNDEDIKMNFKNKKIEPTIRMINRRNRFHLFNLISLADEKLFLLYQALNDEGKKTEIPTFVESLNNIFNIQSIKTSLTFDLFSVDDRAHAKLAIGNKSNLIDEYYSKLTKDVKDKFELDKNLSFNELNIDKNMVNSDVMKLYFYNDIIRVTQIEQYFSCPFKHFLNYGLKLKEKDEFEFKVSDIGNICHRGAELLVQQIIDNDYDTNIDLVKFINNQFDRILSDVKLVEKIDISEEKYSLIKFLKKQLLSVLKDIVREMNLSEYKPKYLEMKFENLQLGTKNPINMVGKADRIDEFNDYFRIIDYKTGKTGNILKELYYGNKLQLFLYQKTARIKLNKMPSGVFYFNAKFEYAKNDDDKVVLKGIVENDDYIISNLDKTLDIEGKSKIVSIATRAKEGNGKYKGSAVAKEPLQIYEDYAKKIADKAVDEIQEGYIEPKPCEKACEYCPFLSICLYENINGERKHVTIGDFKGKKNEE